MCALTRSCGSGLIPCGLRVAPDVCGTWSAFLRCSHKSEAACAVPVDLSVLGQGSLQGDFGARTSSKLVAELPRPVDRGVH